MTAELINRIDACLPQTQCTRCGYPRCIDYAEAVAHGQAKINQCPPGGMTTINKLAQLLSRPVEPLDPKYGAHTPRVRAIIDESRCIGCTLCIDVCPVDAIVGANKRMHTVIAEHCTGCELCLPPCPVDCIDLIAASPVPPVSDWPEYGAAEVIAARRRNLRHIKRTQQQAEQIALTRLHRTLRGTRGKRQIREEIDKAISRANTTRGVSAKSLKP